MESIHQHQNCTECNDRSENQLILTLLDVNALHKRIDSGKSVCEIVEAVLESFEGFPLTLQVLLCLYCYRNLVVYQVVRAEIINKTNKLKIAQQKLQSYLEMC